MDIEENILEISLISVLINYKQTENQRKNLKDLNIYIRYLKLLLQDIDLQQSQQTTHLLQKQANENRWVNINRHCVQDINERFNKDMNITLASRISFETYRLRTKSANPQPAKSTKISHQLTQQYE